MTDTVSENAPEVVEDAPAEAPPAPAPEPTVVHSAASIDRVVSDWMTAHIRNSPIARATDSWNHLQASLTALKDALLKGD